MPESPTVPSLREVAARAQRHIGTALATQYLSDADYAEFAARYFDSVTAENQMKWHALEPEPGRFTFDTAERLVAFAEQNQMRVRGHTLVWHQQLPAWVTRTSGSALHAAMQRHIRGVVEHWRGRIAQWDVVNEACDDAGALRTESPFTALGESYIADAFHAAHAADPNARLFYNDYEIEADCAKTEAVFELLKRLISAGVPVHGVGFQMHVEPRHWPSAEAIRQNLERFAALGIVVEITEMDLPVGEIAGTFEHKRERQKTWTQDIVLACLSVERCSGITLWGFTDKYSWLNDARWGRLRGRPPHLPLPFDEHYEPKPMYDGIVEAFGRAQRAPLP